MNTDHDVRELLERMAREPVIGPIDPEPILRRARRRLTRTAVLGFACVALVVGVAIGGANLVLSSPSVPALPNLTTDEEPSGDLHPILRDGEVMIQDVGSGQLEALDPSTGVRRTILDCEDQCGRIFGYAISADGRWLAYYLTCGGSCPPETGIWVTNALGDEHQLTQGGSGQPWAWSPRGSTLAASVSSGLLTIDPRTGDRTTVATPAPVEALAWSLDGTEIVYAANGLESVDLDSGEITELADARNVDSIAWSPDGSRIVVDDFRGERNQIIVLNRDGSDQRVLVDQGAPQGPSAPAWSPDGTSIAYVTTPGKVVGNQGHFSFEVWVIGADGSDATRLFHGDCCIGDWRGPVWSPDGTRIAFFDDVDTEYGTWLVVDADGTGSHESIDEIEVQTW